MIRAAHRLLARIGALLTNRSRAAAPSDFGAALRDAVRELELASVSPSTPGRTARAWLPIKLDSLSRED